MRSYAADLHIHTCLSPCGELEMAPSAIVGAALAAGLDMIAICDHNSAANAGSVMKAAPEGLTVIPGLEVTTAEEVHILGFFPELQAAMELTSILAPMLPMENDEQVFGMQVLADEQDYVIGYEKKLLIQATPLDLDQVIDRIHRYGGLAVAAHIEREGFGIISKLGMIPQDAELDAVESDTGAELAGGKPAITASDAHRLSEIGSRRTELWIQRPSFQELRSAIETRDGRKILTER